MNTFAKAYVAVIATLGCGVLGVALLNWQSADLTRLAVLLLLGLAAATWKVKLPGITGTISGSFLFILVAVSAFSFSETTLLAATVALLQCFWRARKNPQAVQVVFNVATLSVSAGVAWLSAHALLQAFRSQSLILLLVPAAVLFFVADTGLVSGVIALVEQKKFTTVWHECHGWSFPYYVLGAALAALITVSSRATGWTASLFIVPAMYLVYSYYRFYVERATRERLAVTIDEQEHEMLVSTQ
ncbi:MAG: hypothetical protein ABSG16_03540 [Candidatus Acidiferrum sp.]|jgi:hypothetical protein